MVGYLGNQRTAPVPVSDSSETDATGSSLDTTMLTGLIPTSVNFYFPPLKKCIDVSVTIAHVKYIGLDAPVKRLPFIKRHWPEHESDESSRELVIGECVPLLYVPGTLNCNTAVQIYNRHAETQRYTIQIDDTEL